MNIYSKEIYSGEPWGLARCVIVVLGILFSSPMHSMTSIEQRVTHAGNQAREKAQRIATQQALDTGKTPEQAKQAGERAGTRAAQLATKKEQALVKKELEVRGLGVAAPVPVPKVPVSKSQTKVPKKQKNDEPEPSPTERKWAARHEAQKKQSITLPNQFDNGLAARFGDYLVVWDEEQKKDRVLECSSDTACSLESKYLIYAYQLEDNAWVSRGNIDK